MQPVVDAGRTIHFDFVEQASLIEEKPRHGVSFDSSCAEGAENRHVHVRPFVAVEHVTYRCELFSCEVLLLWRVPVVDSSVLGPRIQPYLLLHIGDGGMILLVDDLCHIDGREVDKAMCTPRNTMQDRYLWCCWDDRSYCGRIWPRIQLE